MHLPKEFLRSDADIAHQDMLYCLSTGRGVAADVIPVVLFREV